MTVRLLLVLACARLLCLSPQLELLPVHCLQNSYQGGVLKFYSHHTVRSREQVMENVLAGTEYEHLDPSTTLTNKDIVKLLMDYCNKRVAEHKKKVEERFIEEYKHTNDMLTFVVNGLGQKIGDVADTLVKHSTAMAEKFEDADLKQETIWSYQEQLMHSLKLGLQDTLCLVENDLKSLSAKLHSCQLCMHTIQNNSTLWQHNQVVHQAPLPFMCTLCGKTFPTVHQISLHMNEHEPLQHQHPPLLARDSPHAPHHTADQSTPHQNLHGSQHMLKQHHLSTSEMMYCQVCALTFQSTNLLRLHESSHHCSSIHCNYCEYSCQDMRLLNLHVQESHGSVKEVFNFDASTCPSIFVMTFPCHKCDKNFPTNKNLEEHIRTDHNQQIAFPCALCAESFTHALELKIHVETAHSKDADYMPLDGQDDDDTQDDFPAPSLFLSSGFQDQRAISSMITAASDPANIVLSPTRWRKLSHPSI